ncbi:hypothetical protein D5086_032039 [Populus alba]|uniref:Uncharacterized protein n=1 Tax=Populus alba TaxID=43335 RepID=A0ACC4AK96_POPAL
MASTKVVSRLSTRLQPFLFKLNKKSLSAELSSLKSSSLPTQITTAIELRRIDVAIAQRGSISESVVLWWQEWYMVLTEPDKERRNVYRCLDAFMTVSFMGTFDKHSAKLVYLYAVKFVVCSAIATCFLIGVGHPEVMDLNMNISPDSRFEKVNVKMFPPSFWTSLNLLLNVKNVRNLYRRYLRMQTSK